MCKDPAILFYTSDFLTGVSDLTMEERGQYITLLCLQHQKGRLSEKTIRLCVGSVSKDVMVRFDIDENGLFFNEVLEKRIEERSQFVESRRVNGNKGGRPKKPSGLATQNLFGDENENENEIRNKNNKYPFDELWSRYPRKEGRKAALKHFIATVTNDKQWSDINKALDNYIKRCEHTEPQFIKMGATWFNDWECWIEPTEAMMFVDRSQKEHDIEQHLSRLREEESRV